MNAHIGSLTVVGTPNIITLTDSYKVSHWKQYPKNTTSVYSFLESRGGKFNAVTFFGLQYYLMKYLAGVVVNEQFIKKARRRFAAHFGTDALFNEDGWRRIIDVHGGKLPLRIKAVPEGTTVPTGNVLMTMESTDTELAWDTNYLETLLSMVWYPSTVATQSREMRRILLKYLVRTGDPSLIDFKLHDFGFRGSTSVESAGIGGAAHLVNFLGTDTLVALDVAEDYYGEENAGFSIPAAEHSTITSWGRKNEAEAFENMLSKFPSGLVAVVSDSYNIYEACKKIWGEKLHDKVLARDGVLVVRPDSGNPPDTVVVVLNILGDKFGYTLNEKGYKVLNPKVRVIQGDGIDYEMLDKVLAAMVIAGWSADNVAFGSGGGLLQKVDRDTQKFAIKCSYIEVDGVGRDVMKDPITDPGKRSKAGRLALVRHEESFKTVSEDEAKRLGLKDELVTVFEDGEILVKHSFADIRARAAL
ncbi:MAG: nicotinate phosphoribosyltransferase [Candidatus Pacebacteria bacterium]|nr:nicotinate phosphoribosyltransferase [Candidatus Paceibacterota bacterium]